MDKNVEVRNEYIKFLILLLFFGGLTIGAAVLRPVILGNWPKGQSVQSEIVPSLQSPVATLPRPLPSASPAATATATVPATLGPQFYRVCADDTLVQIASKYELTVNDLVIANHLTDPDQLFVGQLLRIPGPGTSPSSETYIVQWGDTLWDIANRFEVGVDELAAANQINDPAFLKAGSILFIPR